MVIKSAMLIISNYKQRIVPIWRLPDSLINLFNQLFAFTYIIKRVLRRPTVKIAGGIAIVRLYQGKSSRIIFLFDGFIKVFQVCVMFISHFAHAQCYGQFTYNLGRSSVLFVDVNTAFRKRQTPEYGAILKAESIINITIFDKLDYLFYTIQARRYKWLPKIIEAHPSTEGDAAGARVEATGCGRKREETVRHSRAGQG